MKEAEANATELNSVSYIEALAPEFENAST